MPSSPVQTPADRKAAPSPQATLDALAGLAASWVKEQLGPMAARIIAALADATQPGLDPQAVQQRVKSARLLKENGYAFFHLAAGAIELALKRELDALRPQAARSTATAATLSLVPLEEMDDKLAFAALARPFDIAHSDALATLSVRLGLLLGRGVLRADVNPFRPEIFLEAIAEAWREFEPEAAAHGLIQPLLRPDIVFDLAPLLEALIAALRQVGQPGSVDAYRIQKTDDGAAARAARASHKAALGEQLRRLFGDDGGDDGVPLIPDLPHLPSGNGGWRPSAAAGFHAAPSAASAPASVPASAPASGPASTVAHAGTAAPAAAGEGAGMPALPAGVAAPLPDLLARIDPALLGAAAAPAAGQAAAPQNVFYLPRLKQSLPKGSLSRGDEHTLDLLSRVFETVLLDDSIPAPARELLQALQVPVLKAALLDRNFFFEEAHPARRLVDLLAHMGWDQHKDADDPMFQAMRRSVEQVAEATEAPAEHFAAAVAGLEASIAADEREREAAIAAPVASALAQEKMEVATRAARDAVALRTKGQGKDEDKRAADALVGGFLEQRWTTVLTFAYSIEDARPGAVGNATRAMDDLIWSVKPKPTQEQRKALIARLPRLLTTLNKWLDAIKWQDAERLQFFARLAEYHASIVRAPIELSPQRQLELAVEAAQQDALRRVELENAAAEQAAARAAAVSPVDGLERGMWLEFRAAEGARKVRLAWVSPLRTLFIFSGAGRREAFSMPAEKLAAALGSGRARVLAIDGVVGQVLLDAMQAVNDPAAETAQAAAR